MPASQRKVPERWVSPRKPTARRDVVQQYGETCQRTRTTILFTLNAFPVARCKSAIALFRSVCAFNSKPRASSKPSVVPTPETLSIDRRRVSFARLRTAARLPHASQWLRANAPRHCAPPATHYDINLNCLLELLALRADALTFNERAAELRFRCAIAQRQTDLHANAEVAETIRSRLDTTFRSRRANPAKTLRRIHRQRLQTGEHGKIIDALSHQHVRSCKRIHPMWS